MPLQISQFKDIATVRGSVAQVPEGPPSAVANLNAGDQVTVAEGTRLVRIAPVGGSFNVTWPGSVVERFDAPEFRALKPGTVITATAI